MVSVEQAVWDMLCLKFPPFFFTDGLSGAGGTGHVFFLKFPPFFFTDGISGAGGMGHVLFEIPAIFLYRWYQWSRRAGPWSGQFWMGSATLRPIWGWPTGVR
jgi:hypothetical protein